MNTNGYDHDDPLGTDLADELAELAVLGSILLEFGNNMWQVDFLSPVDFYWSRHVTIFAKMRELYEQEIEIDALAVCGNDGSLHSICNEAVYETHTSLNLVHHATRVHDLSQRRQMVNTVERTAAMIFTDTTALAEIADYMVDAGEGHRPVAKTATKFDSWETQGITGPEAIATANAERKYIVEDFIREESLSIFYGAPGSLKSALVMDMAMCVANCSEKWLQQEAFSSFEGSEQRTFSALNGGKVMWLNYDMAHEDVIERLAAMTRFYQIGMGPNEISGETFRAISFAHPSATLTSEQEARELGRFLENNGYRMVVVDSLLDVKGKVELIEEGIGDVLRMWRFVAEEGKCAVVIIAHNTKNSDTLYGSQFIKAKLDHLYKIERPNSKSPVISIESEKQRSYGHEGKLYARWHYRHFHDTRTLDTCNFFGDGYDAVKAVAVANDNNTKLLKVLKEDFPGRMFSNRKLQELLPDMSLDAVKAAMRRLVEDNPNVHVNRDEIPHRYWYGDEPTTDDV